MVSLRKLPVETLESMAAAGARIAECYRVLERGGSNVVAEVLRGQGKFYESDHYPKGDVYDPETHSQYFYHAHRAGEHGHFHSFLRQAGMPAQCRPVAQSEAPFMKERADRISHIVAISMNRAGFPIGLFTTNRWITAMLRLFRPQIVELVRERDAAVARWQERHPDGDAFEDRDCDITSVRRISVAAQIGRVEAALRAAA